MRKVIGSILVLVFWTLSTCLAQDTPPTTSKPSNKWEKGDFFGDFGLEMTGRSFKSGTFLGDTYRIIPGYRMTMNLGITGYPGLGWYFGSQNAEVLDNLFLGNYWSRGRVSELGLSVFHAIPLGDRWVFNPELGLGRVMLIHGSAPARFILDYNHFFGKVGMQYSLSDISDFLQLNLVFGGSYGLYYGNKIVINSEDRRFVQRSSDFLIHAGLMIKVH